MRRNSDLWEIDRIEKKFHQATTRKDLGLMMSLYAPNATFTFPGRSPVGKKQIREFWRTSKSFTHDWISDTPAYKVRITLNGDRGTLYFECHYVEKNGAMVDRDCGRRGGREDRRSLADHEPRWSVCDTQGLGRWPSLGHRRSDRTLPARSGCPA